MNKIFMLVSLSVALMIVGCGTLNPQTTITGPTNKASENNEKVIGGTKSTHQETWIIELPKVDKPTMAPISNNPSNPPCPTPVPTPSKMKPTSYIPMEWERITPRQAWYDSVLEFILPGTPCYGDDIKPQENNIKLEPFIMPDGKVFWGPAGSKITYTTDIRNEKGDDVDRHNKEVSTKASDFSSNQPVPKDYKTGEAGETNLTKGTTDTSTAGVFQGMILNTPNYWTWIMGSLLVIGGLFIALYLKDPRGFWIAGAGLALGIFGTVLTAYAGYLLLGFAVIAVVYFVIHTKQGQDLLASAEADIQAGEKKFINTVVSVSKGLATIPDAVQAAVNNAVAVSPDGSNQATDAVVKVAVDDVGKTILTGISSGMDSETKDAVIKAKVDNNIPLSIPGITPK